MGPSDIALRAQDVQTALYGLEGIPPAIETELERTVLTGMAARLATHIRGVDVFEGDDLKRLKIVASSLDIRGPSLLGVLKTLEESELIRVKENPGGELARVQEFIPTYGDLYEKIGQVHLGHQTTEIEDSLLETYHKVTAGPIKSSGQLPIEQLRPDTQLLLEGIAEQARLVSKIATRNGQNIYYSPQFWDENSEQVIKVVDQYGDDNVRECIARVKNRQGYVLQASTKENKEDSLLLELAHLGILPSPTVTSWNGERAFAFTPFNSPNNNPILFSKKMEKTRAILSCVRYGEHFGTKFMVYNPVALLQALRLKDKIGSHSEIPDQYHTLIHLGLAKLTRSVQYSDRYYLHYIKNEENLEALDMAINLLQHGEPIPVSRHITEYVRMQGDYCVPVKARAAKKFVPNEEHFRAIRRDMIEAAIME